MALSRLLTAVFGILLLCATAAVPMVAVGPESEPQSEPEPDPAREADVVARDLERALTLTPDPSRGRETYMMCAVCHQPEGWGTIDGDYPQVAGQLYSVIIKQMEDIRVRNRDTPTMYPFTMLTFLDLQQIADVAAYLNGLPMNPNNAVGPGTDLELGERLYRENCVDCHGEGGEGIAEEHMPLIQGQHYPYLVRQFKWIADGRRRNADREMAEQIKGFTNQDISAIMDYVSRLTPPPHKVATHGWQNPDFAEFVRDQEGQTKND